MLPFSQVVEDFPITNLAKIAFVLEMMFVSVPMDAILEISGDVPELDRPFNAKLHF